ncbi:MAG: hypothetical protein IJV16_01470 [Lachnospiraceae bacterium]|nr:hypothetical protein [Lachnospiraceae bacterium]
MRKYYKKFKSFLVALSVFVITGIFFCSSPVICLAEDTEKIDINAISGFGKNYTVDEEGKFDVDGVMVSGGSMYNITVEGEAIQAWSSGFRSRSWSGRTLKKLLNDPTTFFYQKASGTADKAEFKDKVEFKRPNGVNQ